MDSIVLLLFVAAGCSFPRWKATYTQQSLCWKKSAWSATFAGMKVNIYIYISLCVLVSFSYLLLCPINYGSHIIICFIAYHHILSINIIPLPCVGFWVSKALAADPHGTWGNQGSLASWFVFYLLIHGKTPPIFVPILYSPLGFAESPCCSIAFCDRIVHHHVLMASQPTPPQK